VAGFAVVELFTSEGCSSCPAADEALSELVSKVRRQPGAPVFPLAFHVDYFDSPGWRDRFANRACSDRQRAYVRILGLDQPYTPQAIVNGRAEFVGSDRARFNAELSRALGQRPDVGVTIAARPGKARGAVVVEYHLAGTLPPKGTINVAAAERGLSSKVTGGENAGRTLHHDNVVRAFQPAPLSGADGWVELVLPAGVVVENTTVVAYVQDEAMRTLGAAGLELDAGKVGEGK
jgi:hypothetical protein